MLASAAERMLRQMTVVIEPLRGRESEMGEDTDGLREEVDEEGEEAEEEGEDGRDVEMTSDAEAGRTSTPVPLADRQPGGSGSSSSSSRGGSSRSSSDSDETVDIAAQMGSLRRVDVKAPWGGHCSFFYPVDPFDCVAKRLPRAAVELADRYLARPLAIECQFGKQTKRPLPAYYYTSQRASVTSRRVGRKSGGGQRRTLTPGYPGSRPGGDSEASRFTPAKGARKKYDDL